MQMTWNILSKTRFTCCTCTSNTPDKNTQNLGGGGLQTLGVGARFTTDR